jgi:hypothetical protein
MTDETVLNPSEETGQVPEDFVGQVRDALTHLYDHAHLQRHPRARLVGGEHGAWCGQHAVGSRQADGMARLQAGQSWLQSQRRSRVASGSVADRGGFRQAL